MKEELSRVLKEAGVSDTASTDTIPVTGSSVIEPEPEPEVKPDPPQYKPSVPSRSRDDVMNEPKHIEQTRNDYYDKMFKI